VPEPTSPAPDRRDFLTKVAAAAVVVAGTACAAPLAGVTAGAQSLATPRQPQAKPAFDDSWTARVSAAKHRGVFDSPEVGGGVALEHASVFVQGYKDVFDAPESDVAAVVVMRHFGTVIALGDAFWERYEFGKRFKTNDPRTGKEALRNPFIRVDKGDETALISPEASLESLRARGVVLLCCNRALMHFATDTAKKLNREVEEVKAEFRAGLLPGVILQPSGIYANMRAQEVGCGFLKST
jgi:hypothetical protein